MIGAAGRLLVVLAALLGLAAAAAHLHALRRPAAARPARLLALAHAASFGAALLLLVAAFLASRVEIAYVWEHTSARYPWWYKLSGVWGGQKGTVVLWGALVALCVAVDTRRAGATALLARAAALAVGTAFAAYLALDDPFAATAAGPLAVHPVGRGLQEVLVTPFMIIHPPVQFAAYALVTMPAAYAFAGLALRAPAKEWTPAAMAWARPAWLAATVGLGLGGLWAYYVLSFGGFWAWDPVETANLLPWLALTAFLHAGKDLERHEDFRLAAPVLAVAAFALVVFATFATRSGLWISVHAFTDPTGRFSPDAAARLVAILQAHRPSRFFLALLISSLVLAAAALARTVSGGAVARAYAAGAALVAAWALVDVTSLLGALLELGAALPPGNASAAAGALAATALAAPLLFAFFRASGPARFPAVSERGLMHAAVVIFGVALAVTLVLDLLAVNGADRALFDVRAPFVALPLVVVLTARFGMEALGTKRAVVLATASGLLGALAALAFPANRVVAASAPILAGALLATFLALARANLAPGLPRAARVVGVLLLAAGLLVLAVGASPPPGLDAVGGALLVLLGVVVLVGGVLALRGLSPRAAFGRAARPRFAQALTRSGVRLVHLSLVVGLAGYAAATYSVQEVEITESAPLAPGQSVALGDRVLTVGAPRGEAADGWWRAVELPLTVTRDGRVVDESKLRFEHNGAPINHYDPVLDIRRGLDSDLYVTTSSLRVANGTWIRAHGDACVAQPAGPAVGACFTSLDITAVSFTATSLPLVGLVWTGLWAMTAGMVLILAGKGAVYTLRTAG